MFLHELGSSDGRFKQLRFHEGMNILLADKTMESSLKDSRNGAGKTSFIRILRYILDGSASDALKLEALKGHSFWADLDLTGAVTRVERPVSPQTRVKVAGISEDIREWRLKLSRLFGMPLDCAKPTVGQLFAQLARDSFIPLKTYAAEPAWESGLRIGYFLGFSPEILSKAGEISALEKNQKSLKKAIAAGALGMTTNEAELRARLAQIRQQRDQLQASISEFRVDAQYEMHQNEADRLSHKIRDLNDDGVALERRKHDLEDAIRLEKPSTTTTQTVKQLSDLYQEIGVVLPDVVTRRFDEVREFYASVVNNRSLFLEGELKSVAQRLARIKEERASLDQQRSEVMRILEASMALETFREAERKLAELDSQVAATEQKLELVQSLHDEGLHINNRKSEAEAALRAEIGEREKPLEESIGLFHQLGEEIYQDRNASLLVEATNKGVLKVEPKIDGDASAGIQGVKTFLLDMICVTSAIYLGRAPRILVHDSQLFDSMDDRQVASCLNIGARLANQTGFQYIVTMNSDRLAAAEREGFKRRGYPIKPTLTDVGEHGGLFGFRFE
ncbi:ABC-three component system protein [Mobiluncus mulieris]|uniref:ABC-three component system protein n=1 Tax=Mobiluncus mulieris TaxID=2052 RepID=UPI00019F92DA|nr:ABC-three component system protein [Mobiluncus mulieris]EEJ52803.1 hypothetical protein HMPREF0577_2116 [Mobiluncus mulieris ATCC 35243]MCV0001896.1 DUF2326 domain-containing protein [Mobiluncus mulieris]SPX70317.1 Uncharacterized protein conserved in bacteria (DUF2326) [Mobiluncus mulieris]